jgi:hypothetical protein
LKNFNIQIVSIRKSKNEKKISFYFIEHLNYIREILTYKIEKGFKINDTSNLFIPVSTFELKELYIKPDIKSPYDDLLNQPNLLDGGLNLELD